jgi:hypothetical protein
MVQTGAKVSGMIDNNTAVDPTRYDSLDDIEMYIAEDVQPEERVFEGHVQLPKNKPNHASHTYDQC